MTASVRTIGLVLAIAACGPRAALGQKASTEDLTRRVAILEQKNAELELRLQALEARLGPQVPATPTLPSSGDWRNLANWRQLKRGMSYREVRALLGEPDEISGGYAVNWSWGSTSGYATATFINDKLDFWTEPKRGR